MKKILFLFVVLIFGHIFCSMQEPEPEGLWGWASRNARAAMDWGKSLVQEPEKPKPVQPQSIEYFRNLIVCPPIIQKVTTISAFSGIDKEKWERQNQEFRTKWEKEHANQPSPIAQKSAKFLEEWNPLDKEKKANLVKATFQGLTLLHYASLSGQDTNIVQQLLKDGSDVNAEGQEGLPLAGFTPLHLATLMGHSDVVTILLQYHANPIKVIPAGIDAGNTPLHFAAQSWAVSEPILKVLEEQELKPDGFDTLFSSQNNERKTIYDIAVKKENEDLKKYIWAKVFELHLPQTCKKIISKISTETPIEQIMLYNAILISVQKGYADFIHDLLTILFKTYVNPKLTNPSDMLLKKDQQSNKSILDFAIGIPAVLSELWFEALLNKCNALVEAILKTKPDFDINQVSKSYGMNALHLAIITENDALLPKIINDKTDFGIKVMRKGDYLGCAAMHLAVLKHKATTVAFLLGKKANIDEKAQGGNYNLFSPFFMAVQLRLNPPTPEEEKNPKIAQAEDAVIDVFLKNKAAFSIKHPGGNILHLCFGAIEVEQDAAKIKNKLAIFVKIFSYVKKEDLPELLREVDDRTLTPIDVLLALKDPYNKATLAMFMTKLNPESTMPQAADLLDYCSTQQNKDKLIQMFQIKKVTLFWRRVKSLVNKAVSCFAVKEE